MFEPQPFAKWNCPVDGPGRVDPHRDFWCEFAPLSGLLDCNPCPAIHDLRHFFGDAGTISGLRGPWQRGSRVSFPLLRPLVRCSSADGTQARERARSMNGMGHRCASRAEVRATVPRALQGRFRRTSPPVAAMRPPRADRAVGLWQAGIAATWAAMPLRCVSEPAARSRR
jgi:hypothetical protein